MWKMFFEFSFLFLFFWAIVSFNDFPTLDTCPFCEEKQRPGVESPGGILKEHSYWLLGFYDHTAKTHLSLFLFSMH